MDYILLQSELEKPAYVGLSDAGIVEQLNAPTISYYIQPETPDLTNFLMNTGLYMKLLAVYRDHPVPQVRVAAEAALDLAQSQIKEVNLENPSIQQLMAALVQGQVWTQAQADSVMTYARRFRSRAQELLGGDVTVTEQDLAFARVQDALRDVSELRRRVAAATNQVMGELGTLEMQIADSEAVTLPTWDELCARFHEVAL